MRTNYKVALLVRVSLNEQSYDRQVHKLTEYAKSQQWEVVAIIEEKVSGRKTRLLDRSGIKQLYALVEAKKVQKVLISEVTRLGRRTRELLEVIEYLHEHKVSLVVHNYRLETFDHRGQVNSMTQFLITILADIGRMEILADIGRMETETLSERTRSGMEEAKRKGKRIGRPEGLTKDDSEYLKQYPGVVKDLKAGLSIRQIVATRQVADKTVQRVKKAIKHINVRQQIW
jgi:DNA invertase Pin-like site-specific DNA recombinase